MSHSKYKDAVTNLLKATPEDSLSHIRSLRDDTYVSASSILEQKLVSFRVAIKVGNATFLNEEDLSLDVADSNFLKAETHFVRGIILIHKQIFAQASDELLSAAKFYVFADNHDKSLLSRFNAMMAKSNGSLLGEQEELNICNAILSEARVKNVANIQALCLRQKSYIYFGRQKFAAALQEIKEALSLLEANGPISDYHLALIHAADCALEDGKTEQARLYLDYLPLELDSRLEFPKNYMDAKICKTTLNLSLFENISSHWKSRYLRYQASFQEKEDSVTKYFWSQRTGLLMTANKSILGKIKYQSLEAQLLNVLMKSPRSKELICEALWPDFSTSENLDDRFFALKTRLTQKVGNLIRFDGKCYSLIVNVVKIP